MTPPNPASKAQLDATAEFYTQVLGFTLGRDQRAEHHYYLSLERDHPRIGAARATGPHNPTQPSPAQRRPPPGVELVDEVDDAVLDRDLVVAAERPLPGEDLRDRPSGLRDFRVGDPSSYYLRVTDRSL